ncbi:MaoC family dehydratase [Congregibacter sp.]|uniref:MaoC family dehydratase n=1 Tax=Congregibacter sp. TaxID=2744308 RepID=UPI003859F05E
MTKLQKRGTTLKTDTSFSYAELTEGQQCEIKRELLAADIDAFADASGDHNPLHTDAEFARAAGFKDRIAHGMLLASWISASLAHTLPGKGTVYLRQSLEFRQPALPGDKLTIRLTVSEKKRRGRVVIDCVICHEDGRDVLRGSAEVIAPN